VDLKLRDKVIIVTGGARGIGHGIATLLAEEGAIPVIAGNVAVDNEAAVQAIAASGGKAYAVEVELMQTDQCRRAASCCRYGET
jgi:L-fucose dehydrogenase